MKTLLAISVVTLLSGCTAAQQQRFADGYFGEPGHTFHEAMFGNGSTGQAYFPSGGTTLDDIHDDLHQIKESQDDAAEQAHQDAWDQQFQQLLRQ